MDNLNDNNLDSNLGDDKTEEEKNQEQEDQQKAWEEYNQQLLDARDKYQKKAASTTSDNYATPFKRDDYYSRFFSGDPIYNFSYTLRVEGAFDIPLRSIKSITKMNSYEYIQEGGINDYVHLKRKQITEPFKIVVERYASATVMDPLTNGAILTLPLILIIWKGYNKGDSMAKTFIFTGCEVMGKEYGELNAERSGLWVETITISFQEMFTINNYASLGGADHQ